MPQSERESGWRLPSTGSCLSRCSVDSVSSCCTHLACRLQISVSDFDIIQRLGDGSFSTVVLARYKADGRLYAVKIVNKHLVLRNKVGRDHTSLPALHEESGTACLVITGLLYVSSSSSSSMGQGSGVCACTCTKITWCAVVHADGGLHTQRAQYPRPATPPWRGRAAVHIPGE